MQEMVVKEVLSIQRLELSTLYLITRTYLNKQTNKPQTSQGLRNYCSVPFRYYLGLKYSLIKDKATWDDGFKAGVEN